MPIYEYRCADCGRKFSVLLMNLEQLEDIRCPKCKGKNLSRLFSRFAAPRSEEDRLESLADPAKWGDLDENDPKSIVNFMKKMGKEFGDELGEDFDQMIEEAEEEAYREMEKKEKGEKGGGDDLYTPGELSE